MGKRVTNEKNFRTRLREHRRRLRISRREAAKRLKCSSQHLANIENGLDVGSYNFLVKLAELYEDDPLDYLIWRAEIKQEAEMKRYLRLLRGTMNGNVLEIVKAAKKIAQEAAEYDVSDAIEPTGDNGS